MTPADWQERLDRCPDMRPWLLRAARHAVSEKPIPASLTLGDVPTDRAVRRALEEIFPGCREVNGRLKAKLDPVLRDRRLWLPLAEQLKLLPHSSCTAPTPAERRDQTLRKLRLLFPREQALFASLRESEPALRYFRNAASAADDLIALVKALLFLRETPAGITLSELGAKFFNDSKALRGGARRQQFEHLLRLNAGDDQSDSAGLLNACGVIENPYTTHAVVFAPFAYRTQDGAWMEWPLRLWQRGEAAILSWRTVRAIASLRFEEPCSVIVTSENAAPFHRLVESRRAAIYTEGYPNAAVKALLACCAQAGLSALHWGDTDLDGYRIAEQVARCLPTSLHVPSAHGARPLRLTHDQHRRLAQFIDNHPEFRYLAELRHTLATGWLEQEQSIDTFSSSTLPS